MYYSGIDLHKDNCVISTFNQAGKMIKQSRLPNHNISIIRYFSELGKQHKAVVTASTVCWVSIILLSPEAAKKHKNIARNLVALELARITYYVLKNKTHFNNSFKGKTLSRQKIKQWPRLTSPDA